jgi:hypothetical protein
VAGHDERMRRRADLLPRLYRPFALDVRSEGDDAGLRHLPIQPCCHAGGRLRTFYHSDYFRSAPRHADVPPLTPEEREVLDLFESIASEPSFRLDMQLQPGDIQWLSNHTIVHARTAYEDGRGDGTRRHLLRLWLSIEP